MDLTSSTILLGSTSSPFFNSVYPCLRLNQLKKKSLKIGEFFCKEISLLVTSMLLQTGTGITKGKKSCAFSSMTSAVIGLKGTSIDGVLPYLSLAFSATLNLLFLLVLVLCTAGNLRDSPPYPIG